ncbi:hypothetical protein [Candidatus Thiothrix anitrata]|uniref:HEPN domain-containing protein n=1 Tax=Candidatus Thiothrix anitrata TaxID=2823902 RepID=A0ABX7WZ62_9GAMM|nr:hypothetical protein [Candidatus Thiothrix anitrata]QTR48964.1 hypothetical protein J8380_11835 [Candidatus Thiothrix anitrata]
MTDKEHHYLFPPTQSPLDFNRQMFWLSQQPRHWASKGIRLKRDADLFYQSSDQARLLIVSELEKKNFNFARFYRWYLQEEIIEILNNNNDCFLPDFDSYYLLIHLSLENTLKAIWLDQYPEHIGFDNLPKPLRTHSLVRIAKDIKLELSKEQEQLLSKISELFVGYSRYPIKDRITKPSTPNDLDFGEASFDTTCIDCLENPYAHDKELIDDLFQSQLQERVDQVFTNSHVHMQSTFKFNEESDLASSKNA